MKLKYELEMLEIDGEVMAVPIGSDRDFKGILRVNGTTADILKCLKDETTEDKIVAALLKEYKASEADVRESVGRITCQLRENGLLEG